MRKVVLELSAFSVRYPNGNGVGPVDVSVDQGGVLCVLGPSGGGKSTLITGILGLAPAERCGRCLLDGALLDGPMLARTRGRRIGYLPQGPWSGWHPALSVGRQITDAASVYASGRAARLRATALLRLAGCPDPDPILRALPEELSGGLAQRAALAVALAGDPMVLLADEPTSALDTITARGLADTLVQLVSRGLSLVVATHDVGLSLHLGGQALVLAGGSVVETGPVSSVLHTPCAKPTQELVEAWRKVHGVMAPNVGEWTVRP